LFLDSLEAINLNAEYRDKRLIRQKLSSDMFAHIVLPCFQSQFVQVNMNNQFFGLYLKVENIDDHFAKKVTLNPKSNLYKATKDGACLSEFDNVPVLTPIKQE
jgi:spore coat protein H